MSATELFTGSVPLTPAARPRRGVLDRVLDAMVGWSEGYWAGRAMRRYQRLDALDDRQLAGLGLRREDLFELSFGSRAIY